MSEAVHHVGRREPRLDAIAKVTGETKYAGDLRQARMLHARVVRSAHAHARILSVDVSRARAYPGVAAVVTGADLPYVSFDSAVRSHVVMAREEVIFHGQPVAAVLAEEPHVAEEAADLIEIRYVSLPVILDPMEAMKPGAPRVRGAMGEIDRVEERAHASSDAVADATGSFGPNVVTHRVFERGDLKSGFAEADLIIERRWRIGMFHQAYLEPDGALADCSQSGELTVWMGTQAQFNARAQIAQALGIPETSVRVIPVEMGGGFGGKVQPVTAALCAALARQVRRPVRLVLRRSEDLRSMLPPPAGVVDLKIGVRRDGTFTALQARVVYDSGAFPGSGAVLPGGNMLGGTYRVPNLHIEGFEVLTNKVSTGAFRAPGVPQVNFALESQVDILARELGLDPLEMRLKNACREGDPLPDGRTYPRIGLVECLHRVAETAIWQSRHERRPGEGVGIAVGGWLGGLQPTTAAVTVNSDGSVSILTGLNDVSGVYTSLVQIAKEELHPLEVTVNIKTGDTSTSPDGGWTVGSKALRTAGRAVQEATRDARRQILAIAADMIGTTPEGVRLERAGVRVLDPAPGQPVAVPLKAVGAASCAFGGRYQPIFGRGNVASPPMAPTFSVHVVRVRVDDETGKVDLLDSCCIVDAGRAINPTLVEAQIQGGTSQSLGIGCIEELLFDERGMVRNPSLLDYRVMTALDVPEIQPVIVEVPSGVEPFGARGVGEPPVTAGLSAVANAICDAVGVRIDQLPATPERLLAALGRLANRQSAGGH